MRRSMRDDHRHRQNHGKRDESTRKRNIRKCIDGRRARKDVANAEKKVHHLRSQTGNETPIPSVESIVAVDYSNVAEEKNTRNENKFCYNMISIMSPFRVIAQIKRYVK